MAKTALFSLFTLSRAEEFAKELSLLGWKIIASEETHRFLAKHDISVTDVRDFTGLDETYAFPPTLHPKVEEYLTSAQKERIDLVYVIPYPLSVGNDIGGRTLLALAAKGNRIPVASVEDMEAVIHELRDKGKITKYLHQNLINKAYALISSHYDDLLKNRDRHDAIFGVFELSLKNGENPYQVPAEVFSVKKRDTLSITNFKQLSGDPPCFTNLADSDNIIQTLCLCSKAFQRQYSKQPYICIAAKHGNPCGIGIDWKEPCPAVEKALFGHPQAIWGGEVVVNFEIDGSIAGTLLKNNWRKELFGSAGWALNVILAPRLTHEAVKQLGRRKNRKLLENRALGMPFLSPQKHSYRFIRGGFLRQPPNNFILDLKKIKSRRHPLDKAAVDCLIIAWVAAWNSNHGGNEIAIAKNSRLLGIGGGPSSFDAALTAVSRSRNSAHDLSGAVFAANAFFPFTDAPTILAEAGLKTGLLPDGGQHAEIIKDFFTERKMNIVYLPEKYRGFSRH